MYLCVSYKHCKILLDLKGLHVECTLNSFQHEATEVLPMGTIITVFCRI